MTGGDRFVGYLPQPGGERQNLQPQWGTSDGRTDAGQRQLGFQRDGSFVTGRGDTVSLGYQSGDNSPITSFRITSRGGNLIDSGSNQDGSWQTQNNTDLVNVRAVRGRSGNDSYLAFDRTGGKTDYWKGSGRQFSTDSRMPPMDSQIPGDSTTQTPVTRAKSPDGSVTDYQYNQVRDNGNFRSQLQSYDVRDRDGNIKEFAVRNVDQNGSRWVTFKPKAGEAGLLPGVPRDQQEATLRHTAQVAVDPNTTEGLPPGLAGRTVNNPYKQVFSESVSRDGHLYQTAYNGEKTCTGDDGKTYHWHANGMQSVTDGHNRMVASDSGSLTQHGMLKDHFGYDANGRINNVSEVSQQDGFNAQYRRSGNSNLWERKVGDEWQPANVDIRNNSDGSVTIAQLQHPGEHSHENRAIAARTIFPEGGETISRLAPDGVLKPSEILSATGEHSMLRYDQQGKLSSIDQNVVGADGRPTSVHYQPGTDPAHPGHWQKITQGPDGPQYEDIAAGPTVGTGEVSFGGYARIDHRGDLTNAQREAARPQEHYSDASDNRGDDQYYGPRPHPLFRMPRWLLPHGARPSDFVDAPRHQRLSPVAYEGSYYPVVQPTWNNIPVAPMPWQRQPVAQARNYYQRDNNFY